MGLSPQAILPILLSAYLMVSNVKSGSGSTDRPDERRQMLLRLDAEVIKGLKRAAVDLDTTASALVEKLLVPWLQRHETEKAAVKRPAVGKRD
ncbi:hypothetical protein ACRBEV_25580 [Methylobacterium phyllosphaerae]